MSKKTDEGKKEEKFEDTLERLQELVRTLESGECSLEDSIRKFEEGMALARSCQERLTQAEQKIEVLLKADKNGVRTEAFADGEE
jgi:exodeoxyribonuclease VII small subunit